MLSGGGARRTTFPLSRTSPSVFLTGPFPVRTRVRLHKGCRRRTEIVRSWSDYGGVTFEPGRLRDWKVNEASC